MNIQKLNTRFSIFHAAPKEESFNCKKDSFHWHTYNVTLMLLIQGSSLRKTWEKLSPKTIPILSISSSGRSGLTVLYRIYRKNIPKDFHFSSKLQKVKTSPCFKFVGWPLWYYDCIAHIIHMMLHYVITLVLFHFY